MVIRGAGGGKNGIVGAAGDRVTDKVVTTTAMAPVRSKRLHNFTLPTPELTWGNQKFLRCTKANPRTAAFDHQHQRSYAGSEFNCRSSVRRNRHFDFESHANRRSQNVKHKIEAIREKLMFDLKTAADNMKLSILDVDIELDRFIEDEPPLPAPTVVAAAITEERPWNLRTRRAVCKTAIANETNSRKIGDKKASSISPERIDNLTNSSRLQVCSNEGEKKETAKLSVALSRKEIAEDFMTIVGGKLPRRPKKRSKTIQKQMDMLFPGLWLTEVTPEMYKVDEAPDSGMR